MIRLLHLDADVGLVEIGETGENTGETPAETGEAMFGDPPPPALPVITAVDDGSALTGAGDCSAAGSCAMGNASMAMIGS